MGKYRPVPYPILSRWITLDAYYSLLDRQQDTADKLIENLPNSQHARRIKRNADKRSEDKVTFSPN